MKKYIWILGIVLMVIVGIVIGIVFSNKDMKILKCKKSESESTSDSLATFNIRFKNDKMKLIESKSEIVVKSQVMKDNIDVAYQTIQDQFGDYKDEKGVIIKTSKSKDKISFMITVDALENPNKVEIVGSSITSQMTYKDAKKELENRGFSCK